MKNIKQNNNGAILVLVLLVSSVIISASTALLSTSVMNFKMKKLNSRVKRTFYTAEGAMEEAYIIAVDFIEAGVEYADSKNCSRDAYLNFLEGKCEDLTDHKSLADTLNNKSNYIIYKESNTEVNANITKEADCFKLEITTICLDDKIKKELKLICKISIPEDGFSSDIIDVEDLIGIVDWKLER